MQNLSRRRLLIGAGLVVAGCATNPEKPLRSISLVDEAQLAELDKFEWDEWKRSTPMLQGTQANARLERVGGQLAAANRFRMKSWDYALFDRPDIYAFSVFGGRIGCFRGLMEFVENDDQLAFVIGHEMSHQELLHRPEQYSQDELIGVMLNMSRGQAGGRLAQGAMDAGAMISITAPYSRRQESEADTHAVELVKRAGYHVRQSVRFLEIFGALPAPAEEAPAYLATHPGGAVRVSDLRAYINKRGYARL